MKKEVRIDGTEFTLRRREWTIYGANDPADMAAFSERMHQSVEWSKDPWDAHRRCVEWATRELAAELSDKPEGYRFKARVETGWYLDRLVMLGRCVEYQIERAEPSWIAHEAALFGETWAELQLKLAREELYLIGKKAVEDRAAGGAATRKQDSSGRPISDAARVAVYRRYRDMGLNRTDATDQAAKELGLSVASIRKARKGADASD